MSTDKSELQSTNVDVDVATTVAVDLSSLRSATSNIPNIIAQLLHMYQPEDGIAAYERVLRKVQNLLEDRDSRERQLLLSTIPAPKNAPDRTIEEVFRATTGFVKLDPRRSEDAFPNTRLNNVASTDRTTNNSTLSSEGSFSRDRNASSSRSSLSEGFPFRGFAESEISSTIRCHARNADPSANNQSDNDPKNWSDGCNKRCQMSTYRQYLLNKRYYAPARGSGGGTTHESRLCYSSRTIYQDTRSARTLRDDSTETIADPRRDKILRRFDGVRYDRSAEEYARSELRVCRAAIDVGRNDRGTIERAIRESVRSMDVCWEDEDQSILVDVLKDSSADDLLATARDGLKTSLRNFLRRAREEIFIELSAFPRVRPHPRADSSSSSVCRSSASKDRKSTVVARQEEDLTTGLSSGDGDGRLPPKRRQNGADSAGRSPSRASEGEKTKRGVSHRELDRATAEPLRNNDSDYGTEKSAITAMRCREDDNTQESTYGRKAAAGPRSSDVISEENHIRARSMSEIAAYKRRYYDTLLSVQRAKVAVTNSLAAVATATATTSSSSSSTDHLIAAYDDPYYTNYGYQRRRQLFAATGGPPQFSTYDPTTALLPGLSGAHDTTPYGWARSDCKYLLLKQLRLRRQASPLLYARDQEYVRPR